MRKSTERLTEELLKDAEMRKDCLTYMDYVMYAFNNRELQANQRFGQWFMNLLKEFRPELLRNLPTELDVFYLPDNQQGTKFAEFCAYVHDNWNTYD